MYWTFGLGCGLRVGYMPWSSSSPPHKRTSYIVSDFSQITAATNFNSDIHAASASDCSISGSVNASTIGYWYQYATDE